MSHTDRNTFGLEHGKIGDRIAVVLDGKQIYKKLYKPTNPRTPKQQMHRGARGWVVSPLRRREPRQHPYRRFCPLWQGCHLPQRRAAGDEAHHNVEP